MFQIREGSIFQTRELVILKNKLKKGNIPKCQWQFSLKILTVKSQEINVFVGSLFQSRWMYVDRCIPEMDYLNKAFKYGITSRIHFS